MATCSIYWEIKMRLPWLIDAPGYKKDKRTKSEIRWTGSAEEPLRLSGVRPWPQDGAFLQVRSVASTDRQIPRAGLLEQLARGSSAWVWLCPASVCPRVSWAKPWPLRARRQILL